MLLSASALNTLYYDLTSDVFLSVNIYSRLWKTHTFLIKTANC